MKTADLLAANWPQYYKIAKRRWEIVYVPKTDPALILDPNDLEDYALGICRADLRTIWICTDQSASSLRDTLWHELVHACFSVASMAGAATNSEDEEENVVLFATSAAFEIINGAEWPWYVGD